MLDGPDDIGQRAQPLGEQAQGDAFARAPASIGDAQLDMRRTTMDGGVVKSAS